MSFLKGILKKLVNNLGLKIISLLAGLLIWIVVVGIDNPLKTQIFTGIPVSVENAAFMEKEGKAYEVDDSSRTVSISVRAERAVLNRLSRDNFTASIDLEDYSDGRVPISVKANRYADKIVSITPRTTYAKVTVEDLGEKQFGIEAEITGEVPDGYSVGTVVVNNNIVKVSGPISVVDSIDRAIVKVSVQGMTRDIRTESKIEFMDNGGTPVDTKDLELSRTDSSVSVAIWTNKNVPVSYGYTGVPADGYAATGNIIASVENIDITGASKDLAGIDYIDIPGTVIDITGAESNVNARIDISRYLPGGVAIASADADRQISDVAIEIQPLSEISVEVPISNITIENVPEGMTATITEPVDNVVASVKGLASSLAGINPAMITGKIDLNETAVSQGIMEWKEGAYDANVTFIYPEGLTGGNQQAPVKIVLHHGESSMTPAEENAEE
ncbi:MAG: hypothetical protein J5829_04965 [Lachnospiraceae bacterium]|nr:hypothetical protein [Lachnospiraceae bacterium]